MIILQNIIESKYHYQPSWLLVVIILGVMILGYIYSAFNSKFNTFVKAVFLSRFLVQASREERSLSHPVSLLLSFNFNLISSLLILQIICSGLLFSSGIEFTLPSFLLINLIILAIYFIKILFLKILSFIIDKLQTISEYIFIIFLVNQFFGIVFLPIVIFIAYSPSSFRTLFIYVGIVMICAAFLIRVGKGISTVLANRQATLFYLILYFCTLEILPLLIGIKLLE